MLGAVTADSIVSAPLDRSIDDRRSAIGDGLWNRHSLPSGWSHVSMLPARLPQERMLDSTTIRRGGRFGVHLGDAFGEAMATLTFHGAAGTVTGSRFMLEARGERVLVDCGMFQGLKELRDLNWKPPQFEARRLRW